ncbi:MAG: protein-glutamate O-methyltransferase CheR [bacterium]
MAHLLELSDAEFTRIRQLVYSKFGINLTDQKRALVLGRLNKVLRDKGFNTFSEYYDYVTDDTSGKALSTLIDRISTNHTFFWRESDHFEYFANATLPDWVQRLRTISQKKFRIWIAGSSSGEESYLIAMLMREMLGKDLPQWDVGILATDISVTALEKAIRGVYTPENVNHLPDKLKINYMQQLPDGNWEVRDEIRQMVVYRRLNLMRPDFPFKGSFQVVFCRNVMIYFDRPTRDALIRKFHAYMDKGATLFIGHSETLGRTNSLFQYIKPAIYRRIG